MAIAEQVLQRSAGTGRLLNRLNQETLRAVLGRRGEIGHGEDEGDRHDEPKTSDQTTAWIMPRGTGRARRTFPRRYGPRRRSR